MIVAITIIGIMLVTMVMALLMNDDRSGTKFQKRLARVQGYGKMIGEEENINIRRTFEDSAIPFLDQFIKQTLPNPDLLRARLERTGKKITVGTYLLFNGVVGLVFYIIVSGLMQMPPLVGFLVGIAGGLFVPHMIIGFMGNKRIQLFLKNFPEAIDTMVRGLKSGLPVSESIAAVGRELPDPVGFEFRRITDSVRLGKNLDQAMWEVARRIDTPEFRFLIIAMAIQRETGGNLAETLSNLSEIIRKRRQLRLKIKALSSEARASALIIGSLPFIMFLILFLVNKEYMLTMVNTEGGRQGLLVAFIMMTIGHGTMAKMIRFEI